jgi:replicative DNA helicase
MRQDIISFGKVPPHAIDCEEAVLGTILIYPESMNDVIAILTEDMFYKDSHKTVYRNAIQVFKKFNSVDMVTLTEQLRANNELDKVGGPVFISQLTSKIISGSQIEFHAMIIKEKYLRREMIRYSSELQSKSFDETFELSEMLEFAESNLFQITENTHKKEPVKLGRLVDWLIDKIQKIINHEIKLIGTPSGFMKMDRMTGGFKNGELIIIAGRPSMGKSALGLQIAINNAEMNIPVALFSCEMSGESLAQRSLSAVSDKTNVELMQGHCDIEKLLTDSEKLINLPVYIDDSSNISVMELRSKARKLVMKHGIKMIIVDYLQLMKGEGQSREQEVASISRGLKAIAKDMDLPVIALSQLNRQSEARSEKRPQLSDLRESGAIEQDADMVIFPYRPAYYGLRSVVVDGTEKNSNGLIELIIAKNRNGAIGSFYAIHNIAMTEIKEETEPY